MADPTQIQRTKKFVARKSVSKAFGQLTKTQWTLSQAIDLVHIAVDRDAQDGNSAKRARDGGMLSTVFVALSENQQAADISSLPWMSGYIDNASTAIFLYCIQADDVETLKTLYTWAPDFQMVSPDTDEDGVCDIANGYAKKCYTFLTKRRSLKVKVLSGSPSAAPTIAAPRARHSPKKKLLLLFKDAILRVIAKHRAARAMADKEAAHFAALTLANREEAAKRAAIREAAKRAKEKKKAAPVARAARLPPFPTVVIPPAPPTPRRVVEKAASLEAVAATQAKRAAAAKADAEARERCSEARRIGREIGGS